MLVSDCVNESWQLFPLECGSYFRLSVARSYAFIHPMRLCKVHIKSLALVVLSFTPQPCASAPSEAVGNLHVSVTIDTHVQDADASVVPWEAYRCFCKANTGLNASGMHV